MPWFFVSPVILRDYRNEWQNPAYPLGGSLVGIDLKVRPLSLDSSGDLFRRLKPATDSNFFAVEPFLPELFMN